MAETAFINDLPPEIFLNILNYLDGNTLGKCRRVCKKWKECISSDHIWYKVCQREFKYASNIAKEKASSDVQWYHVYRNMKLWPKVMSFEKNLRKFFKFSIHDINHILNVQHGILPLRDMRGILFYDLSTLKNIPVALREIKCLKIASNEHVTVIQLKRGILLQRTVITPSFSSEEFFIADAFVLGTNVLYYHCNRDVYQVDLTDEAMTSQLILHCDYKIKEILYYDGVVHLFTNCGKIVTYDRGKTTVQHINCPPEWISQIKYIRAVDDKNYLCYSRTLFQIETEKYKHLYLELLPITALFFYVDNVLIGTCSGKILLYRLESQKKGFHPLFEEIACLPSERYAVQLDVCERKKGPMIIISTLKELYMLEFNFHPSEPERNTMFTTDKFQIYKRLRLIKERLRDNN